MEKKLELGSGPILVRRPYVWYPCCLKLIFFFSSFFLQVKILPQQHHRGALHNRGVYIIYLFEPFLRMTI